MARRNERIIEGSVVQINEAHGRDGWIGAFVLVTEIKSFGVMGFVHHIDTHDEHKQVWIRLPWDQVEYVGEAVLMPFSGAEEEPVNG